MPELPTIEVTDEQKDRIYAAVSSQYGVTEDAAVEDALLAVMINAVNATVNTVEANALRAEMNTELQGKLVELHEGLPEAPSTLPAPPLLAQGRANRQAEALVAELNDANEAVTTGQPVVGGIDG